MNFEVGQDNVGVGEFGSADSTNLYKTFDGG